MNRKLLLRKSAVLLSLAINFASQSVSSSPIASSTPLKTVMILDLTVFPLVSNLSGQSSSLQVSSSYLSPHVSSL